MKTIYSSNSELTKTFNKQSQDFGKANSMYFNGETLYSYGRHYPLAIFIRPETILINNIGYSNTTSKHISVAIRETKNRKQFLTSEIELGQVLLKFEELERKLNKARKPERYAKQIQELKEVFDKNVFELEGFYIKTKSMFSGVSFEFVRFGDKTKEQDKHLETIFNIFMKSLKYTI